MFVSRSLFSFQFSFLSIVNNLSSERLSFPRPFLHFTSSFKDCSIRNTIDQHLKLANLSPSKDLHMTNESRKRTLIRNKTPSTQPHEV